MLCISHRRGDRESWRVSSQDACNSLNRKNHIDTDFGKGCGLGRGFGNETIRYAYRAITRFQYNRYSVLMR